MHRPLSCVPLGTSVDEALGEMDAREAHLGVTDGDRLAGFLSQRDLLLGIARERIDDARAEAAGRLRDAARPVDAYMTRDILHVGPGDGLSASARTMVGRRISALPVFEDGHPIGLLTQRDVLEYYASLVRT